MNSAFFKARTFHLLHSTVLSALIVELLFSVQFLNSDYIHKIQAHNNLTDNIRIRFGEIIMIFFVVVLSFSRAHSSFFLRSLAGLTEQQTVDSEAYLEIGDF